MKSECSSNKNTANTINNIEQYRAIQRNVMVLSWLTPTNNQGKFMFSINKSRYSASLLAPHVDDCSDKHKIGVDFTLCVPTKGMEQLVLDVGSVSGQFGSKFSSSQISGQVVDADGQSSQLSNRKRKKMEQEQFSKHGIPGLIPVPFGCLSHSSSSNTSQLTSDLFAIQGTIAHLHCRTYGIMASPGSHKSHAIDDDHLLVLAEVLDAYVQSFYWDSNKLLFCPQGHETEVQPYLTFFGSQMFGYVTAQK